jgi:polysaccharide transporter, PST family
MLAKKNTTTVDTKNIKTFYSNNRRMFSNINSLTILQLLNYAFPIITMPYLVQVLGIVNYGTLVFSQAIALYFVYFTNYGFYLSAPREISRNIDNINKRNEIISSIFIIKTIFMVISMIVMTLLIAYLDIFKANSEVFLISMMLVVSEVVFPVWFFQGIEDMRKITILSIIGRSIALILMFVLVTEPDHIGWAAFTQSSGGILSGIIAITLLFKQYNYKFKLIHVKKILKTLVEGWNLFTYQLSTVLFANTNITMLGLLSTPEAVGVYSIGEKIVRLVISLVSPISSAIFPNISKLLSRSFTDGVNKLRYILKIGGILFFFISLMLFLSSDLVIQLLFGKDSMQSSIVIKILSLLPLFIFINNIYGVQYMVNAGMEKQFRNIVLSSSAIFIVFSYILVNKFNIYGAAVASFLIELFLVLSMIYYIEIKSNKAGILRRIV